MVQCVCTVYCILTTHTSPHHVVVLHLAACPADITGNEDRCQEITATVRMSLPDEENRADAVDKFEFNLYDAIFMGRLQEYLDGVHPNASVYILTGKSDSSVIPSTTDDSLSSGVKSAIVLSALLFVLVPLLLLLYRRSGSDDPEKEKAEYAPYLESGPDLADDEPGSVMPPESVDSNSVYTETQTTTEPFIALGTLGASEPNYGKMTSRKALEAMEAGEDIVAEPEVDIAPDSSSNAGSSGWSSSAGISSLNTGSLDDSMDAAAAAGATLASIGVTSALSRKIERGRQT
jgi:hypothetical protein